MTGPRALVRVPSPRLAAGELTYQARVPVDMPRALAQHAAYVALLAAHGHAIVALPELPEQPDGVFVEDVLVLLDDRLILTRPGAESRRAELASAAAAADALALATARIDAPGTLDGGDVLVLARHVLVGDTARSNGAGFEQLAELVRPTGRQALRVPVAGVLHLKSALTALPDGALIAAPAHVDASALEALGYRVLHAREPSGADVLCLGSCVVLPTDAPRTRDFLRAQGYRVETVDVSELQKLEAGVTCMSVLIPSTE